jgi:choline dehydrogenase-like flavoprotein
MGSNHDPRTDERAAPPAATATAVDTLTGEELKLRSEMIFWNLTFVGEILLYLWWAWGGGDASRAFAVNSVAKDLTFLVLGLLVVADVRRFGRLMTLLVIGHLTIALVLAALVVTSIFTDVDAIFPGFPGTALGVGLPGPLSGWELPAWCALAALVTGRLAYLSIKARRARFGLAYLFATNYDTLVALTEAAIREPRVTPQTVARAVDRYWAGFNGSGGLRARMSLTVLYLLPIVWSRSHVPFPLLDVERRRAFLERRFIARAVTIPDLLRTAIRFCLQQVYMGYYSQPETEVDTGYTPFSRRATPVPKPDKRPTKLTPTRLPATGPPPAPTADVVIVGSGAAAGILAHELVQAGNDVLMLERGRFVDPASFTENELEMYSTLYSDGAVQLSRDFTFQVLQGRCVGGGTVVNNAVCFELPRSTLDGWNASSPAQNPLIGPLDPSFQAIRRLMCIRSQDCAPTSPGVKGVTAAMEALVHRKPNYGGGVVDANIMGCAGCGYCNIGCAYGKKLSMLSHLLPQTQLDAVARQTENPQYAGRLRVVPDCEVLRIDGLTRGDRGQRRAGGVVCRVGTGADARELRIAAGSVVVAAGAIHSSRVLQRSQLGMPSIGRGLCANLATFMIGDFERPTYSNEGLQIAHYVAPPDDAGYVLETWVDPVVVTALSMPGWLEQHEHNMHRYSNTMCVGVLVGTAPQAGNCVHRPSLLGNEFRLRPSAAELRRLSTALGEAGELLFDMGAQRVMPATFDYREMRTRDGLGDLHRLIAQKSNRSLQTAHPQGGNPLSDSKVQGVVDRDFRVHGFDNLYVCDASVFPTAITVNPQLTVMALAHYATTRPDGLGRLIGSG